MTNLKDYANKYQNLEMERRDGILELRLHTRGGPHLWSESAHRELSYAFTDIACDTENKVVILTGKGDSFCADLDSATFSKYSGPDGWDKTYLEAKRLLQTLLEIGVPVIGAVNGPALVHAELAVLSDIVIASDTAVFADDRHFRRGTVPGDGVHLVWPLVLGVNRGRYFLLTGQRLSAKEALAMGVVSEVVPKDKLMARAWELAYELAKQPYLTLRYTRETFVQPMKRVLLDGLGYGLALEGMTVLLRQEKK